MTGDTPKAESVETGPFIDVTGEYPTAEEFTVGGRCYGSSADGGECEGMDLSFPSIEEWRAHRRKYHPVSCGRGDCVILSAYKRHNAPHSYCFKHIPENPDTVYRWQRANEDSVVEPPRADEGHPIEAALRGLESE